MLSREYLKNYLFKLEQELQDAQNNAPIKDDEYYESDSYYQGAIETVKHLLKEIK
jgi:hypothetical protein